MLNPYWISTERKACLVSMNKLGITHILIIYRCLLQLGSSKRISDRKLSSKSGCSVYLEAFFFFSNCHVQVFLQPQRYSSDVSKQLVWMYSSNMAVPPACLHPANQSCSCVRAAPANVCAQRNAHVWAYMPEHAAAQHLLLFTCLHNTNNRYGTRWNGLHDIICAAHRHLLHSQHLLLCSTIKFSTIKRKNGGEHVTAVNVF